MTLTWQSEDKTVALYCGDCLKILPEIGRVDAVITDPPYGIEGGSGFKGRRKGDYNTILFEDTPQYISTVCVKAIDICRKLSGCVVLTPGMKNMMMYPQPDSFGCFYSPAAISLQPFGNMDAHPIFYYGKNATRKPMGKACSHLMTTSPEKTGHPCTKPFKSWVKLVLNTTLENQIICDPFMGSGTTGVACIRTGRRFIGIEISPEYFEICKNRIIAELRQPSFNLQYQKQKPPTQKGFDL